MKPLAFKIQGELENRSELHIATNNTYTERGSQIKASDLYPLGKNLRGAFGYLFLDLKVKTGKPRFDAPESVISRGMGDRTSFGKGEFAVS
jgi:hypothetical protein